MYSFLQNYMIYSPLNVLPLYFTLSLLESSLWLSSESFMLSSFICAVLIWSEHYSECLTRGNHYLKVLMGLNLRHVVEVNDALILTTALICWLRTSFLTTRTPSFRRENCANYLVSIINNFFDIHFEIDTDLVTRILKLTLINNIRSIS